MTTIRVFCEECNSEFLLDYVDVETEPKHCPFCTAELDDDFIHELNGDEDWDDEMFEWHDDDDLLKE